MSFTQYTADDTRQNAAVAASECSMLNVRSRRSEKKSPASTAPFFTHCFGRASAM
jgi:hypothetical protein